MLSVEHVTKRYGNFTALEEIDLTFEKGVYGLLAPNGAGKTTLLKLLATLLFPTEGVIRWEGENILTMGAAYRGLVGYLPQRFGYYKNYTPIQFLEYMAALQCMERRTAKARIEELLEQVGLGQVKHQKMRRFSGGMLQRVGIAQAVLNDPKILILDEPTAGLDPRERVRFRNLIRGLAQDRIVLLSTHIVSDVETIADWIVMIRQHKILCCERPDKVSNVLQGRLFETPEGLALPESCLVLGQIQSEGMVWNRVVSERPLPESRVVAPTLEDAFLYLYREGET